VREPSKFEKYYQAYQALRQVEQDKKQTNKRRKCVKVATKAVIAINIYYVKRRNEVYQVEDSPSFLLNLFF